MSKKILSPKRIAEIKDTGDLTGCKIPCHISELSGGVIHFSCASCIGSSLQLSKLISAVIEDNPRYELAFNPMLLSEGHTIATILVFKKKKWFI